MSQNSSSSVNGGHSLFSQAENMFQIMQSCIGTSAGIINLNIFLVTCCLIVVPLSGLVIYISVRHWLQSSSMTASHSDHFTYQAIINKFLTLIGVILSLCGVAAGLNPMAHVGLFMLCSNTFVLMFFDTLTCMERYVAVVHPITYRNFKNVKGVRVRNAAIGCAWLLSFLITSSMNVKIEILTAIIFLLATALCIAIVFFCSLSVLFVLIRPGPGKVSGSKRQLDESKLRAFHTIVIILAVLLLRLGANVLLSIFYALPVAAEDTKCHLILSMVWMTLPGSMVQPLLFIQRAGWFACCKSNK